VRIRTERLWLRPFATADADRLDALFALPEIRRFLLDDRVMPRAWIEAEIRSSQVSFESRGWGLFCITLEETGPAVGFTGYREFQQPPVPELLYGLDPSHWGRGLAREASGAALRYGAETLGLDPLRVSLDAPNQASHGLALRLGFREVRRSPGPVHEQVHLELARRAFVPDGGPFELHREPSSGSGG